MRLTDRWLLHLGLHLVPLFVTQTRVRQFRATPALTPFGSAFTIVDALARVPNSLPTLAKRDACLRRCRALRIGQMTTGYTSAKTDLQVHEVTQAIIKGLIDLDQESRQRVFRTALTFFGIEPHQLSHGSQGRNPPSVETKTTLGPFAGAQPTPRFGDRPEIPAKDFLFQKSPQTDIERVACLGFYLAHYRDTPHFKTIDISRLNTEAAQIKFSNGAFAVANATNAGLLTQAGKGNKQLSALGERYVEALPDREAAKAVLANFKARRQRKSDNGKSS